MENKKLKVSIHRIFEKLVDKSFDEYDIKLLLIDLREFLHKETFLREVADFVAHPERNKGICHQAVDSRYARMKMARIRVKELSLSNILENNKDQSERFATDQILNYIDPFKINKQDYALFVQNSLEDIDEKLFLKYYKLNKNEIKTFLSNCYTKQDGYFIIKKDVSKEKIALLVDILKFTRGTITSQGILTQTNLSNDLRQAIRKLNKLLGFSLSTKSLEACMDSIVVCILALLHGSNFIMHDSIESRAFLSINREIAESKHGHQKEKFTLILMVDAGSFIFPIVTTEIKFEQYIDDLENPEEWNLKEIPWVYTKNLNGALKLIKNER